MVKFNLQVHIHPGDSQTGWDDQMKDLKSIDQDHVQTGDG